MNHNLVTHKRLIHFKFSIHSFSQQELFFQFLLFYLNFYSSESFQEKREISQLIQRTIIAIFPNFPSFYKYQLIFSPSTLHFVKIKLSDPFQPFSLIQMTKIPFSFCFSNIIIRNSYTTCTRLLPRQKPTPIDQSPHFYGILDQQHFR